MRVAKLIRKDHWEYCRHLKMRGDSISFQWSEKSPFGGTYYHTITVSREDLLLTRKVYLSPLGALLFQDN
jgi:hypothetical protein